MLRHTLFTLALGFALPPLPHHSPQDADVIVRDVVPADIVTVDGSHGSVSMSAAAMVNDAVVYSAYRGRTCSDSPWGWKTTDVN